LPDPDGRKKNLGAFWSHSEAKIRGEREESSVNPSLAKKNAWRRQRKRTHLFSPLSEETRKLLKERAPISPPLG